MEKEFFIESPHTKEECLKALDDVSTMGDEKLVMYRWGCSAGDHTGRAFVMAEDESEALEMVPESIRGKAKAISVEALSKEQIEGFHK